MAQKLDRVVRNECLQSHAVSGDILSLLVTNATVEGVPTVGHLFVFSISV